MYRTTVHTTARKEPLVFESQKRPDVYNDQGIIVINVVGGLSMQINGSVFLDVLIENLGREEKTERIEPTAHIVTK